MLHALPLRQSAQDGTPTWLRHRGVTSGVMTRTVYPEVPPRVEYGLTELGRELIPVLEGLHAWGVRASADG
ncbi:MAG: winged helix-turn-helix transcriptional regulator [Cyanobacteria bacterium M_surface_10_m2_119]|nr:winged helix-turn-helix transcriptional regulator [Cyanobacteria bacterium M_surface_10_m2_119]